MDSKLKVTPRTSSTPEEFQRVFLEYLYYLRGKDRAFATPLDNYIALSYTVREGLIHRWLATIQAQIRANTKMVYYLSAEYLMGRQLAQNLMYLEATELAQTALAELGLELDHLKSLEPEPGLGNGGLGRLGACFLDSLATMSIPNMGYGIRYEFGIFRQSFQNGWQVESPDNWLYADNPWDFAHPDEMVEVGFGGYTEHYQDDEGCHRVRWIPGWTVLGVPHNTLVPGYKTNTVNALRLWQAKASYEFSLKDFDAGNYDRAVAEKTYSENISKVLYPNDNIPQGKRLRLEQQYFFVACSIRDIIRQYLLRNHEWDEFPHKVAIQLNDTHPNIAVAELMRLFVDECGLEWEKAWEITQNTFASTQHTLLPEALEKWPVSMLEELLPRHLEIIYEINRRFLEEVQSRFPDDPGRIARMSLIEEGPEKRIRMSHLACVGSHSVNGVAALQSKLLKSHLLRDFSEMWPEKFNNKTNGVTPRRFLGLANPGLARLITAKLGSEDWLVNLDNLQQLEAFVDDPEFRQSWREIRYQNKQRLADTILNQNQLQVNPDTIFDIMVKRLHEYKRQLLKALHIITLYNRLKADPAREIAPYTFIFGAKAAPGYYMAKLIIKLINSVADVVNHDPDICDRLKVVFLANFNVSLAEWVYPAADISEQISLAGKEASGTGNMKFALNGAVTVGTLDGANIEIRERVGADNFFLFGLTTEQVFALKAKGYNPLDYYNSNVELKQVIDGIASGYFSGGDKNLFKPIVDSLLGHDEYMLLADYQSYIECQDKAAQAYQNRERWTRMSILNTARSGFFSSDRTIRQYCEDIWRVQPLEVQLEE
jgi:starch phosphorylase